MLPDYVRRSHKSDLSKTSKHWDTFLSHCKSFLSCVYHPVGVNGGGSVSSMGKSLRGSPVMFCRMRNLSGSLQITDLTFSATGLYFFFAVYVMYCSIGCCSKSSSARKASVSGVGML